MDRRVFLGLLAGIGVPGCAGSDGSPATPDTDTPTRTPTETPVPTTSAADYIEIAKAEVGAAGDRFAEQGDKFDQPEGGDIQTEVIFARLDRAENALASARPKASGDELQQVENLQNIVAWLRATAKALDHMGEMFEWINTGTDYSDVDRYEDAASAFEKAQTHRQQAAEDIQAAQAHLETIDTDRATEFDEIDYIELKNSFEEMANVLDTFEFFISGTAALYRGFDAVFAGLERYEAENYADAESRFRTAQEHFTVSSREFRRGEETASSGELRSSIIELTCFADAFKDGSEHFETASRAAENGDIEAANAEISKGEEDIKRCES